MTNGNGRRRAHGSPTKEFFIRMITRDISLRDCIVDLLDNSVDGARRTAKRSGTSGAQLNGFDANIQLSNDRFVITDNCGGISLGDAIDYAFHFGRRKDAPADVDGTIGLYGIGMKRAIFKMGRHARVESRHRDQSFVVVVDVDEWENGDDWDFDIDPLDANGTFGTTITLTKIYPTVAASFGDPTFANELIRAIARDYAFVIQQGFKVQVGDVTIPDYAYRIKQSGDLTPGVNEYTDDGVRVRVVAGIIEELQADVPDDLRPEKTDRFGWYIVCNDRLIVAGNKTDLTVWGNAGFQVWHNQYNGFAGFLFLWSDDPEKLPWTTTKREVDIGNPLYLRALVRMKELTETFISYTNERRADPEAAKRAESAAPAVALGTVKGTSPMRFPSVTGTAQGREYTTISYRRPKQEVKEVAEALGNVGMAATDVGKRTFDYFRRKELGK
jgi:hypothetical protein